MLSKGLLYYRTSQSLEITVWRDGMEYTQKYSRGKPVTILKCLVLPDEKKDFRGTRVRFWPDKEGSYYLIMPFFSRLCFLTANLTHAVLFPKHAVFTTAIQFDYNTIAGRIRELAFLNPKVKLLIDLVLSICDVTYNIHYSC